METNDIIVAEDPLGGEGCQCHMAEIAKKRGKSTGISGKKLTFDEASRCLNTLGKDETGVRYAYLMITATDKELTDVSVALQFRHVLFLDFSFNRLDLEALQVLAQMPFLLYLKATNNKIDSAALEHMPYLQVLILNRNCVSQTEDINQQMLETLDIEYNHIFVANFINENVPNLKFLNLKGNHLMDLSGNYPTSLKELFLSENNIMSVNVNTMRPLKNLTRLHLRDNNIRCLNGFCEELENLQYVNLRNNRITKLRELRKLQCLPKLDTLILIGNPVMYENDIDVSTIVCEDDDYYRLTRDPIRICVLVLLPRLKRINKDIVTMEEFDQSVLISNRKYEEIMDEPSDSEEDLGMMGTETAFSSENEIRTYIMELGQDGEGEGDDVKIVGDDVVKDLPEHEGVILGDGQKD